MPDETPPTKSRRPGNRRDNRRAALLNAAARRFAREGYSAASLRDIAGDAGMLAGSIYYYFPSKEDLLVAVYEEGVRRIAAAVDGATADQTEPWKRLETAMTAHLTALLESGDYAQVVTRDLPSDAPEATGRLVALRDSYEERFRHLVDDLPLSGKADSHYLRLMLLGALNWSRTWYRPGGDRPADIARRFVALLRTAL